jgi:hypothetical protein
MPATNTNIMVPAQADQLTDFDLSYLIHHRLGLEGVPLPYATRLDLLLGHEMRSELEIRGVYEIQVGWEVIGYFATVYAHVGTRAGDIAGSAIGRATPERAAAEAIAQATRRLAERSGDAASK